MLDTNFDPESQNLIIGATQRKPEPWGHWLWRHGSQIAKGGAALGGLIALGTVGYLARGLLGRGQSQNTAQSSGVKTSAIENTHGLVSQDASAISHLEIDRKDVDAGSIAAKATTNRGEILADGSIDFGVTEKSEITEEIITSGAQRALGVGAMTNDGPTLTANQLTITEGQTVVLSTSNLNATDTVMTGLANTLTGHTNYVFSVTLILQSFNGQYE